MYCKVKNCRFSSKHTTIGHKCGSCNEYGHGQAECGNRRLMSKLRSHKNDIIPLELQCSYEDCKWKWTHTTSGHICHKCNKNHHERDCILQSIQNSEQMYRISLNNYIQRLNNYVVTYNETNCYTTVYMGMGCMLYIRKKNGQFETLYMHSDNWGQYGIETDHSNIYTNFIRNSTEVPEDDVTSNTYQYPYCRSENSINKALKLKGNEQKCCVCMENTISIYSPECEHSVLCQECFTKIC